MIVVKVGGSLFDLPDLRDRLRAWLARLDADSVLLVPGGGATADAVRAFDRLHSLGEDASHWLVLRAMSLNARFLHTLLPVAPILSEPEAQARGETAFLACAPGSVAVCILDAHAFFQADEARSDHLPHSWQVTSDSLAVRTATLLDARELILLKSAEWEGNDWLEATRKGIVDGYFPEALRQSPDLRVRVVNLRAS